MDLFYKFFQNVHYLKKNQGSCTSGTICGDGRWLDAPAITCIT